MKTAVKYVGRIPQTLRSWCDRNSDKVEEVEFGGGYTTESGNAYDIWLRKGWRWKHDTVHSIIEPTVNDALRKLRELVPCDCSECLSNDREERSIFEPSQERVDREAVRLADESEKLWGSPGFDPADPFSPQFQRRARAAVIARAWWKTTGKPVPPSYANQTRLPECPCCKEPLTVTEFTPDDRGGHWHAAPCNCPESRVGRKLSRRLNERLKGS